MGRPKLYHTPEERREAKRRWNQKYAESERGRLRKSEYVASPEARALERERYVRYRQTDRYRATQARYRETEKSKATQAVYRDWLRATKPFRYKAMCAIASAIRRGTFIRPGECQTCGVQQRPDAHHYLGYEPAHWLDVQWLCRRCHKAAHGYGLDSHTATSSRAECLTGRPAR